MRQFCIQNHTLTNHPFTFSLGHKQTQFHASSSNAFDTSDFLSSEVLVTFIFIIIIEKEKQTFQGCEIQDTFFNLSFFNIRSVRFCL